MQHPAQVAGLPADELAEQFSQTTYEFQKDFFAWLATHYAEESVRDKGRGYARLGNLLSALSPIMGSARILIEEIWRICKPHTKT